MSNTKPNSPACANPGFQLVAELAVGQNHTCQEGSQGGREVYNTHECRNTNNQHQRCGGENLSQPGLHHVTKQRTAQVIAANNDGSDRTDNHKGCLLYT